MIHQISRAGESQTFASGTRLKPQSSQPRLVQYQARGEKQNKTKPKKMNGQQNGLPNLQKFPCSFSGPKLCCEIQVSTVWYKL